MQRGIFWVASAAAAVVVLGLIVWSLVPILQKTPTERASIAVLPFANLGGDPGQDYLGEGISAEVIASLSKFAQLLVIAEGSSSRYQSSTVQSAALARK